jgi:trigger factor
LRFQGKTLEEFAQELRPEAEARLRRYFVLEAFAEAEGIQVSEEELEAEIERLATASGRPDEYRALYNVPSIRSYLADELHERKVSERLLELVTEGRGPVVGEAAALLAGDAEVPQEALAGEASEESSNAAVSSASSGDSEADLTAGESREEVLVDESERG